MPSLQALDQLLSFFSVVSLTDEQIIELAKLFGYRRPDFQDYYTDGDFWMIHKAGQKLIDLARAAYEAAERERLLKEEQ